VCTEAGCDGLGNCDQRHVLPDSKPCPDTGNDCAVAGCDGAGSCDQKHVPEPNSRDCGDTDGNVCTEAGCDGVGNCDQRHRLPDSKPCPDTENECAAAGCDGQGSCDQNHVPEEDSTPCTDTDGVTCTIAGCDGLGTCDQLHRDECRVATCRTPGFWGTHAGNENKARFNLTQTVLNICGPVTVCGDCLNATDLNNKASAEEAICVSPSTDKTNPLQLARQLTAMALNCCISGFGTDCSGDADLAMLFSDCNTVCPGGAPADIATCVDAVDCFNNGGDFDGSACMPREDNCHERDFGICANGSLCGEGVPCTDGSKCAPGPASSSRKCNDAIRNRCTVLGNCTSDTCP